MNIDPRGIMRTVKAVDVTSRSVLVYYVECDHVGEMNPSRPNAHKVGDDCRCYHCGIEARKQQKE